MAIRIRGSTIASLLAQRELNNATDSVARLTERLASGLRINRVGDDPAGLALANSLEADTRIVSQGRRNINDAVSLLNIADAASGEISNVLSRMAELAGQAANGTYSSTQRKALNDEYQALSLEIQRITATTEYNGINLFEGQAKTSSYTQVTNTTGAGYNIDDVQISGDGKTVLAYDAATSALQYIDVETGEITTIATFALGATAQENFVADASLNMIAFISQSNLTGQNAAGYDQIFLYNRLTDELIQVTDAQGAEINTSLAISADGSTLVFNSATQYDNTPTYGATQNVYTYSTQTREFTNMSLPVVIGQVALRFSLSSDGSYLSYLSNADPFGTNADGNVEYFIQSTSDPTNSLRQVTQTTGIDAFFIAAAVNNDGEMLFGTALDPTGSNPSGFAAIYRYSYESDSLSQISVAGGAQPWLYFTPDGTTVQYLSNVDPNTGTANPIVQVFEYDLASGTFEQSSHLLTQPSSAAWAHSGDTNSLVFVSPSNITGQNGDGNAEILLLDISNDDTGLVLSAGSGDQNEIEISLPAILDRIKGIGGYLISTAEGANGALDVITTAIEELGAARGEIGASLSRLGYTLSHLAKQEEELRAAESRIRDVDVATTVSELLAAQIRQQVATSVLAQANQSPRLVLQLLGQGNL